MTARVTIGMPVFNNAETLRRAVASVLAQTYQDWELLITDDQSDDETFGIAQEFATADPRISVRVNDRRMVFHNFELALRKARTAYFVWLAGDDYWDPAFLEATVAALDAAPSAVSVIPSAAFIGEPPQPVPNLGFLKGLKTERIKRYLAHPGGTRMYGLMRTKAARTSFPMHAGYAYDWYFMVSLLSKGPQLSLPECLHFREETGWITYAECDAEGSERFKLRRWPVFGISWQLLKTKSIPIGALPALLALNARKHEEYLAVNEPDVFLRRLGLFKRIGLPLSNRQDKLSQLAEYHSDKKLDFPGVAKTDPKSAPVVGHQHPEVTAIVTCRNAEAMLPAFIDHYRQMGVETVVIDHGSTDDTERIATGHLGTSVKDIISTPFFGAFDLTAQLELKSQIMQAQKGDWVIHADVDEFLTPKDGLTIPEAVRSVNQAAFACEEYLHLPLFEDEVHDSRNFRRTMNQTTRMMERDEKQRLFRRDAPLDVWMATGGHTISRRAEDVALNRLRLDHYLGLSLDDIRGQYYSRVFARRDLQKLWHLNRKAAAQFDIVGAIDSLPKETKTLPIFRCTEERRVKIKSGADIVVLAQKKADFNELSSNLSASFPGLRLHLETSPIVPQTALPVLNFLSHPAWIHRLQNTRGEERQQASAWTRRLANARQAALERSTPYAEIRMEDLQAGRVDMRQTLQFLLLGAPNANNGMILGRSETISMEPYTSPVKDITKSLAADLGYR
ncbi:glycosyltransferase [uncultured Tateyamaria sp.]|uniref:glycosyltransferase n=1 Tax=uncultured Tateyamaria sp. TaxID=455651 RepID=UPI00261DA416|nr:glycosyltransferase [uncultured Tateyamaria sp.]